ncbi:MAG: PolC-type DNA polymerase III, partial [Bacteriovoracia bacterium]
CLKGEKMNFEELAKKYSESYALLNELKFCVFDLETTGGNHKSDKIIEVGMVRVENLKIVDEKHFLINPEIRIPEFIQKLTEIKPQDLINSPTIEEVIDEIIEFMGDTVLVAHNSSFDVPFFNSVLKRLNKKPLKNKVVCTNLMTKYLIPGIMNSNLPYMGKLFDIEHTQIHRAIEDARATAQLLLNFLSFFIKKNIRKVNQLYYPRNRFELDRLQIKKSENTHEKILKEIKQIKAPMIIVFKGEQGLLLGSLPIENLKQDYLFVKKCLKEFPWEVITIRLVGSYLETLLISNQHITKGQKESTEAILDFLRKKFSEHDSAPNILEKYDFVVGPHLVVEQFVTFPILNLNHTNPLIFRYPSHKKKLNQYVNSHITKFEKNPLKRKICFVKPLRSIVNAYLARELTQDQTQYLFLKRGEIQNSNRAFLKRINSFTSKHDPIIYYPKEHI